MNIIITADWHVQDTPAAFYSERDGRNIYLNTVQSVARQIRDYMLKNKVPMLIHAGDLYDTRNRIPVRLISFMQEIFHWFYPITIALLRGTPFHEGEGDSWNGRVFQRMSNVQVFDQPDILYDERGGGSIYMLPWNSKPNLLAQLEEWNKDRKDRGDRILIGHYALDGAETLSYEAKEEQSLSKRDLRLWDWVFFGHFHKFQQPWKNAYQIGSSYKVDFSEREDFKGFIHFDNGLVKFIRLNVPGMAEITLDGNKNISKWDLSFEKDCFVKVILQGNSSFVNSFDQQEFRKKLTGALAVKFERKIIDLEEKPRQVRINKEDDPEHMVERYLGYMKEEGQMEGLNPARIKKLGLTAMKGK